jgi:hypothetical protein
MNLYLNWLLLSVASTKLKNKGCCDCSLCVSSTTVVSVMFPSVRVFQTMKSRIDFDEDTALVPMRYSHKIREVNASLSS